MDDYYELLGVPSTATTDELKQAYRDLTKVWHPDRFPGDPRLQAKAQEKLKEINNAYEQIRNHRQRDQKESDMTGSGPSVDKRETGKWYFTTPTRSYFVSVKTVIAFVVGVFISGIAVYLLLTMLFG